MTIENRLRQYVEEDDIYKKYKKKELVNPNDFEKFCIQHCKDIEYLLNENRDLKKKMEG